ncbi:MAG: hypothetical protein JWO37_19 [Acidimicrobiales bacterium]|jgi:hypothetical protein|nr:hypothetical protein [Acidimicrobiales bacterium]
MEIHMAESGNERRPDVPSEMTAVFDDNVERLPRLERAPIKAKNFPT